MNKTLEETTSKPSFLDYYKSAKSAIDHALEQKLLFVNPASSQLVEALRYSVLLPSKRIRPVMALMVGDFCGLLQQHMMPLAIAIELIHTYSLIHDDLPCMDNDDYRRGKPTNHKVFGEAVAVLAGDTLMTYAYELMTRELPAYFSCQAVLDTVSMIAQATGVTGMAAGQVLDIEAEGKTITAQQLQTIHQLKTGVLITASMMAPLRLAESSPAMMAAFKSYAEYVGLTFQIVDDILDEIGTQEMIGKPVGSDKAKQKSTYVSLFGLEQARQLAQQAGQQAKSSLSTVQGSCSFFYALVDYVLERNN